jgi:hypothetical protein
MWDSTPFTSPLRNFELVVSSALAQLGDPNLVMNAVYFCPVEEGSSPSKEPDKSGLFVSLDAKATQWELENLWLLLLQSSVIENKVEEQCLLIVPADNRANSYRRVGYAEIDIFPVDSGRCKSLITFPNRTIFLV